MDLVPHTVLEAEAGQVSVTRICMYLYMQPSHETTLEPICCMCLYLQCGSFLTLFFFFFFYKKLCLTTMQRKAVQIWR